MKREKESWGCRIVTGIHMGVSSVMFTDASFVGASGTRFRIDERGARRGEVKEKAFGYKALVRHVRVDEPLAEGPHQVD